jgi:hypothetical protein
MNAEEAKLPEGAGKPQKAESELVVPPPPDISPASMVLQVVIILVVAIIVAGLGIASRIHARAELIRYTNVMSAPPVSLAQPSFEKSATEIVLPGNMQTSVPTCTKANCLLKSKLPS